MSPTREAQVQEYGWTAVPCDPKKWAALKTSTKPPVPQLVENTPLPDTAIVKSAMEYAKAELPAHTFNHSMRVFYYGMTSDSPASLASPVSWSNYCHRQALLSPDSIFPNGNSAMRHGCSPVSSMTSAPSTSTPVRCSCHSISTAAG